MLSSNSTDAELFEVLAAMLNELRDDHTNLITPFNVSRYNLPLIEPANFHQRTIEEHYIPNAWITGAFVHDFLENEQIGHIRYGSFMSEFGDDQLDLIINRYKNTSNCFVTLS